MSAPTQESPLPAHFKTSLVVLWAIAAPFAVLAQQPPTDRDVEAILVAAIRHSADDITRFKSPSLAADIAPAKTDKLRISDVDGLRQRVAAPLKLPLRNASEMFTCARNAACLEPRSDYSVGATVFDVTPEAVRVELAVNYLLGGKVEYRGVTLRLERRVTGWTVTRVEAVSIS